MKRTKQINVSVPLEHIKLLEQFDMVCKDMKQSRSETILGLIAECVEANYVPQSKWQQTVAKAAEDEPLPEFLS